MQRHMTQCFRQQVQQGNPRGGVQMSAPCGTDFGLPQLQPATTIRAASQTKHAAAVAGCLSWKSRGGCCLHSRCQKESCMAALELLMPG